ncbi:hypothetical protein [Jannaschia sp. R86511]|uniref:hypothetical protein n=1 Tax=Jannaschia sp. R86511 TaxID=3093853 RepID=UPI0036D2E14B
MEWWGLGLVGAVVFFWWLGREPVQRPGPDVPPAAGTTPGPRGASSAGTAVAAAGTGLLAAEVLRRATDMNDADGTFMDGYVAGRLTERAESRDELQAARDAEDGFGTSQRWSHADDEAWDELDPAEDDLSDDW